MKILVLGTSDSNGESLADRRQAWPKVAASALEAISPGVVLTEKLFYVHIPGSGDYLDAQLRRWAPDVVLLATTAYAFTMPAAGYRLENRLGRRAGKWARERVEAFDAATWGQGRWRGRVNTAGRWVAGHTVGRETQSTYEAVTGAYLAAIDRVAREESCTAVLVGSAHFRPELALKMPRENELIRQFNVELATAARRRHLGWVDQQRLIEASADQSALFVDAVHKGPEVHELIAAEVVRQVLAARAR